MKFDAQQLNIAALAALLFMSVYHVFSSILHGLFIVSFLFLFNSVLCTLALFSEKDQQDSRTKLTFFVLLLSCFSLFVFMLTQLDSPNAIATWFCIFIFSSSVLLSPSQAFRFNLVTLIGYWLSIFATHKTLPYIESAVALTLITLLALMLSQVTQGLVNKLDLSIKTDALTGCIQPDEFKLELIKVTQLFERYQTPFSLICIKYESTFASENDLRTWLKELAQLYQSRLRKTDVLCRFNSQKFMILLPSTQHINADIVCSDLKRCAEAYEFSYQKVAQQNKATTLLNFTSETFTEQDNLEAWFQALQAK